MVSIRGTKAYFRFYRPDARSVRLVGDFNHWDTGGPTMTRTEDGWWVAALQLGPGTYRFQYLADGAWFSDYAAFGLQHGLHGWVSVVQIEAGRHTAPREASAGVCAACGANLACVG